MSGKIKGITLTVGGDTTGLRKELSAVNKETASIQKELREVEKSLKLDPKNTELLAQKQKLLGDAINSTEGKLKEMKKAQEQADKEIKNGTQISQEQYRLLQREIVKTEANLKDLKDQSKKTNDEIADVEKPKKGLGDLKSAFGVVTKGATAFAAAGTAVVAGLSALEESTREYREDLNKLKTAFISADKPVESAKKAYSEFYAILGEDDRAVEAVSHLAELTNNEKELTSWTTIAAGVTAKFGDSLPIEGLTEAANETAKVGQVTGVLADALNWVGISEDKFNEKLKKCSTEQERSALITETLRGAYQEAADTYSEMNSTVMASREAQQKWNDAMAYFGEAVAPAKAAVISFGADGVAYLTDLIKGEVTEQDKLINSTKELIDNYESKGKAIDDAMTAELAEIATAEKLFDELEDLVGENEDLTGATEERAKFIKGQLEDALGIEIDLEGDVQEALIKTRDEIAKVVEARKAQILFEAHEEKWLEAEKNKQEALQKQKELYIEMQELEAKIDEQGFWNTSGDEAKQLVELKMQFQEVTNQIKEYGETSEKYNEAAAAAAEGNSQKVIEILDGQGNAYKTATDVANKSAIEQRQILGQQFNDAILEAQVAAENYNNVQSDANKKALEDAIKHAANAKKEYENVGGAIVDGTVIGIDDKKLYVDEEIKKLWEKTPEELEEIRKATEKLGEAAGEGFGTGIDNKYAWVMERTDNLISGVKTRFTSKEGFDIHSPSRWAKGIAVNVTETLANGITDNIKLVQDSFKELFGAVEEEHKNLTEEEEKYNSEIERIRMAGIKSLSDAQLEDLNNLALGAEERRKIVKEAYKGMAEDVQKTIDDLNKSMESYKKGLSSVDLTETKDETIMIFNGKEIKKKVTSLADLSDERKWLEQFKYNLFRLEAIGIDESMMEQIKALGGDKGGLLAQALLDATPEQREQFIDDFKAIEELSGEVTAEVYKEEIEGAAYSTKALFEELNPDFLKIGEDWGTLLGTGLASKLREAMQTLKNSISSIDFGYNIPSNPSDFGNSGGKTVIYNTEINQSMGPYQPQTAFEAAEQTRRVMENLKDLAVLS